MAAYQDYITTRQGRTAPRVRPILAWCNRAMENFPKVQQAKSAMGFFRKLKQNVIATRFSLQNKMSATKLLT